MPLLRQPLPADRTPLQVPPTTRPRPPQQKKAGGRGPLVIGIVVGVAILGGLVAVGVAALGGKSHSNAQPNASASPSAQQGSTNGPSQQPVPQKTRSINDVVSDPWNPTVATFFSGPRIDVGGRPYSLAVASPDISCTSGLGATLGPVEGPCTELLRATYKASTGAVGTVGVAILDNDTDAKAMSAYAVGHPGLWLLPVPGRGTPKFTVAAPTLGKVKQAGRYVIFTVAGYADAKNFAAADPAVDQIAQDLFAQAMIPIRARMSAADKAAYPEAAPSVVPTTVITPSPTGSPALG